MISAGQSVPDVTLRAGRDWVRIGTGLAVPLPSVSAAGSEVELTTVDTLLTVPDVRSSAVWSIGGSTVVYTHTPIPNVTGLAGRATTVVDTELPIPDVTVLAAAC